MDGSFLREREDSKRERFLRIKQKQELESQLSTSKKYRYIFVAVITGAYCIAELGVAVAIDSLALLSDGFHNLGDLIALAIAWWCEQNKTRKAEKQYTYGFQRAEILGGLANGWALVALAFLLGLETIPRFYEHPDLTGNGWLFIAIAAAGVLINTVGTLAFARDGHGHSHGPKASEEEHHLRKASSDDEYGAIHGHDGSLNSDHDEPHGHSHGHSHGHDLNMRAVFLHYLGDSLSSICVLIEGIFLHVFDDSGDWVNYLDPTFTIVIISIILITTWPLLKECSKLVLQTTPNNIDIDVVKDKLLKVSGVSAIHDVHLWTLSNDVHVAALHFQCLITADCRKILSEMREVLHQFGIHSSTLQPDFIDKVGENPSPHCEENCVQNCTKKWCCQSDSINSFNLEST